MADNEDIHPEAIIAGYEAELHPCRRCAGKVVAQQHSNRDPQYWVTCLGCDNAEGGESLEEAVTIWNANNTEREVLTGESIALATSYLQKQLDATFIQKLQHAISTYYHAQQPMNDVQGFGEWCAQLVGQPEPASPPAVS